MRLGSTRSAAVPAAIVLVAALAFSQDLDRPAPSPRNRVRAVPISPLAIPAGSSRTVALPFEVTRGYHINSNTPKSDLLLPTVLKMDPPTDILVGGITYPAGQDLSFPFAPGEKLNVYTGDFTVTALVRAARTTPPGRYRVRATLKYQACDDKLCYPPAQVPLAFDVQIGKGKPAPRRTRRNPPQSPHIRP